MNRIYRVIWCRARQAAVVVSELATRRGTPAGLAVDGRTPLPVRTLVALAIAAGLASSPVAAQGDGDGRLADLQALMDKYDPPKQEAPPPGTLLSRRTPPQAVVAAPASTQRPMPPRMPAIHAGRLRIERPAVAAQAARVADIPRAAHALALAAPVGDDGAGGGAGVPSGTVGAIDRSVAVRRRLPAAQTVALGVTDDGAAPADEGDHDDARDAAGSADDPVSSGASPDGRLASASLAGANPFVAGTVTGHASLLGVGVSGSASANAVPTVPPPSGGPSGLAVGNGGVVGAVSALLGTTTNSLFQDSSGYVSDGSLKISNANFTQGYSVLSVLGIPTVQLNAVGNLLTTTGGTVVGGTGINSHMTLVGGVTSGNYISNINNGASGGLLGVVLPNGSPAWASTCLNVLGVLNQSCWAVNAAQDYQVLVGDGASANGSKEVVIGTNASHTLPTVSAATAFPGNGYNDPNNPTGVPTADYDARQGHSVVIGDDASGTANAQTVLGAGATASAANSIALGYASSATRGAQAGYTAYGLTGVQTSAGELSIGASGQERQITHVAPGSAPTDAVNVAQLQGVTTAVDNAVMYDDAGFGTVTLAGPASTDGGATGGTRIANLQQGALSATSTDAVNGAQLYATNSQVTNIYDTGTKYLQVNSAGAASSATGTDALAAGPAAVASGDAALAIGSGAGASAANGIALGAGASASMADSLALGAGSQTLVGALTGYAAYGLAAPQTSLGEVNIGDRQLTGVAAGSAATDAVNVAQLQGLASAMGNAVTYDDAGFGTVTLAGPASTDGGATGGTRIANLQQGALNATSTDAVNGAQLYATNSQVTNIYDTGTRYFHANSSGADGTASGADSVAIGSAAAATGTGDVAIGLGAATEAAHAGTTARFGASAAGVASAAFSVGAQGQERQIQFVAPGVISAGSTDAVNGSQLFAVAGGIDLLGSSLATAMGGSSSYDAAAGQVVASLSYDGTSYSSVQDVLDVLGTSGGGAPLRYVHFNSALADGAATGQDSMALGPQASASGSGTVAAGVAAEASGADALALGGGAVADQDDSVALGANSHTVVGAQAGYAAYALSAPQSSDGEVNIGNRQLTGLAAGSAASDAVNVAQLQAVAELGASTDRLAVKYDQDSGGDPANTVTLVGDGSGAAVGIANVLAGAETAGSLDAVNGSQLFHWTQDTGNAYSNYSLYQDIQNLTPGGGGAPSPYFDVHSTLGAAQAGGQDSVAIGPVATAGGTDSVALGHGASASADNAVAIGANSEADRADTVSVGSAGAERQITHVAAGTAATDAVNVAQLDASVSSSQAGSVRYDANGDGGIDYGNVTLGNGGGPTVIHNVGAAAAAGDAVNLGQLQSGMNQAVNWANAYTDRQIREFGNRANAGVASAMAMAGLPQAYEPGRSMASFAASTFRGESSLALGISMISEGGRWVYKLTGTTDTRGDSGVALGAGIQW